MVTLFKRSSNLFALRTPTDDADAFAPTRSNSGGVAVETRPANADADVIATIRPAAETDGSERRMFTRKEIHCRVQGKRMDHTLPSLQEPHISLSLRDLSLGGLSAISEKPVDRGERVAVFFPPQGAQRGWDAFGRVVRCDRGALGFRIAVEFDTLPAA